MDGIIGNVLSVFGNFFSLVYTSFLMYIPKGTGMILLSALVMTFIIGVYLYLKFQPTAQETLSTQAIVFQSTYDALAAKRKGVQDYLKEPLVKVSMNNWVLLNFAPLTVSNAGYLGPDVDGVYDPLAIRQALDLGFRSFVFHIDFYQGEPKDPEKFVPPGDPCLLHRDDQGVIRSVNCGRISTMAQALADQAFSTSLNTGKDPLIVILLFKNTPDRIKEPGTYTRFLSKVAEELQPLRPRFLARINNTRFSNLENPNALFTQKFEDLMGNTLIFTNANTDVFTTGGISIEKNLRSLINAQIYTTTGGVDDTDTVTQPAPQGTQMAVGTASGNYFFQTPPDRLGEATRKTNNVFTYVKKPSANDNFATAQIETLGKTYGVQAVGWNLYKAPTETQAYLTSWGPYSWKLKPPALQYIVIVPSPPKPISKRADANQGNPSPPALHL
jgi:hypothetical protein